MITESPFDMYRYYLLLSLTLWITILIIVVENVLLIFMPYKVVMGGIKLGGL